MPILNELHTSEPITVKIGDLFLDPTNPRIAVETEDLTVYSNREIVSPRIQKSVLARISSSKNKISDMVNTLRTEGFANNMGVFWVKEILDNKYIVLEGNRRVTAMKEILDNSEDVSDAILNSFNHIRAEKFIYTPNEDYTEEEVISIILAKIHITAPLGWGAMQKGRVIYDQHLKELRIYLGAEVNDQNFALEKEPIQNVTKMFDLPRNHAKKNIKTYRIYKQLKRNDYEIDTDRFTLIEMATTDADLSDYFEMNEHVQFSNAGLERFYKLCVENECPVTNPVSFRQLAYIHKHGETTHLDLVINRESPIAAVHEQVVALKKLGKVESDLEEIKQKIMCLPLLGFTDSETEWDLIQDISNLVETKLVPLISGEDTTSNDDTMPTTAHEALDCTNEELQGFVLKTLEGRPNMTCQVIQLPKNVIQYLRIHTSGQPRVALVERIKEQIPYLETNGLIERYNNGNRFKLLSTFLSPPEENEPVEVGSGEEQYSQAEKFYHGDGETENKEAAFALYKQTAEQGHAEAQYMLGVMYNNGEAVEEDEAKAFQWISLSAEQDCIDAWYYLGLLYNEGWGVPEDKEKAVEWYTKAAEEGHSDAQLNLGYALYVGQGIEEDLDEALVWITKSAMQENEDAKEFLAQLE